MLANLSGSTGRQERTAVYTALLGDGSLFYAFGVASSERFSAYTDAFRRVMSSIQFMR